MRPKFSLGKGRHAGVLLVTGTGLLCAGLPTTSGCTTHQCDGSVGDWGLLPGQGNLVDEDTWESTPIEADWLEYQGAWAYNLYFPALGQRMPHSVLIYLSAGKNPHALLREGIGTPYTLASGNLGTILFVEPGHVAIRNDTCGDYYFRVVVSAPKMRPALDAAADSPDASLDEAGGTDATSFDAGSDASD